LDKLRVQCVVAKQDEGGNIISGIPSLAPLDALHASDFQLSLKLEI